MSETRDWHSKTSNDRVTFPGGKLDEVVGSCGAHLEHMGGGEWFLSITHDDDHETVMWFKSKDLGKFMEVREPVSPHPMNVDGG